MKKRRSQTVDAITRRGPSVCNDVVVFVALFFLGVSLGVFCLLFFLRLRSLNSCKSCIDWYNNILLDFLWRLHLVSITFRGSFLGFSLLGFGFLGSGLFSGFGGFSCSGLLFSPRLSGGVFFSILAVFLLGRGHFDLAFSRSLGLSLALSLALSLSLGLNPGLSDSLFSSVFSRFLLFSNIFCGGLGGSSFLLLLITISLLSGCSIVIVVTIILLSRCFSGSGLLLLLLIIIITIILFSRCFGGSSFLLIIVIIILLGRCFSGLIIFIIVIIITILLLSSSFSRSGFLIIAIIIIIIILLGRCFGRCLLLLIIVIVFISHSLSGGLLLLSSLLGRFHRCLLRGLFFSGRLLRGLFSRCFFVIVFFRCIFLRGGFLFRLTF